MIQRVFRLRFQDARSQTIWLTVYADLITNLTLVFLTLFGLTMMGEKALQDALTNIRLGDIGEIAEPVDITDLEKVTLGIRHEFDGYPDISISEKAGMARVAFGEKILFESGGSKVDPSAGAILEKMADILRKAPFTVVVEGHTDNVPIRSGSDYKDNWELSLARAMSLVHLLVEEGGLRSDQLAAAAYGPHRPKGNNETSGGRRANRRVEIALYKDFPYGLKGSGEKEGKGG